MSANGNSYVSTVKSEGNELWQPATAVGAANGSTYRVTDMYIADIQDRQEIQMRQQEAAMSAFGRKRTEAWSWGITVWNAVACLLCPGCIYCMFGALLCNVFAYIDHRYGDYAGKRHKLLCAVAWSVGAFITSIIVVIIIIVILFVVYDAGSWTSIPTIPGSDFTM